MTTSHGKNGIVKIGANTVLEVKEWEVVETAETADDSAMGDVADSHQVGRVGWTAKLSVHWDPNDATGQEAMAIGQAVTPLLYGNGDASGDRQGTGTGTVTNVTVTASKDDIVSRDIELLGNGAFTWSDLP